MTAKITLPITLILPEEREIIAAVVSTLETSIVDYIVEFADSGYRYSDALHFLLIHPYRDTPEFFLFDRVVLKSTPPENYSFGHIFGSRVELIADRLGCDLWHGNKRLIGPTSWEKGGSLINAEINNYLNKILFGFLNTISFLSNYSSSSSSSKD